MQLPRSVLAVARALAMALAVVVVTSATFGWLYWLRPALRSVPGPHVLDALPLDELPGHAAVSLLLYVLSFGAAGAILGLTARLLRLHRVGAALAIGVGTAIWLYATAAVSIFIVRQVGFGLALGASMQLEAIYLAAGLCAAGGALVAHRPDRGEGSIAVISTAVTLLGLIDVVEGSLPLSDLRHGIPNLLSLAETTALSRTSSIVVGVLLLLSGHALGRRSRAAWFTALALLLLTLVLRIFAGFGGATTVIALVIALGLLARRHDFSAPHDPNARFTALVRFSAMAVLAFVFGIAALFINRTAADLPFTVVPAMRSTIEAFVGIAPHNSRLVSGDFTEWFPWSVLSIFAAGIIWAAATWFAPWRERYRSDTQPWRLARRVVRASGSDSLAPFVLRADKTLYFYPEAGADLPATEVVLIAYRVVRGVAIVSGDPIGPPALIEEALAAFREFVERRGWRLAILGASERWLEVYRGLGLRAMYHGEEAVIDTACFGLDGGAMKSVRQAAHRLARNGYGAECLLAGEIGSQMRHELATLEQEWLAHRLRRGFVMEFDELFRLDGDEVLFVVGRTPDGSISGFLQLAVCHAASSLSLSSMPRHSSAPNGLNAFLIVRAVAWAREQGYGELSLNFSPFARLFVRDATLAPRQRAQRAVLRAAKWALSLQLDNLLVFNQRFSPRWQARYVVYEGRRHLPRVAIAAMAAERYLPFTDWLRGRDWTVHPVPPTSPQAAAKTPHARSHPVAR